MIHRSEPLLSFYGMLKITSERLPRTLALLNPYPGHRMEKMHQKGILVGHVRFFRHVLCEFDPHVQTFHIHLLRETIVFKIDQKNGLLCMEPD